MSSWAAALPGDSAAWSLRPQQPPVSLSLTAAGPCEAELCPVCPSGPACGAQHDVSPRLPCQNLLLAKVVVRAGHVVRSSSARRRARTRGQFPPCGRCGRCCCAQGVHRERPSPPPPPFLSGVFWSGSASVCGGPGACTLRGGTALCPHQQCTGSQCLHVLSKRCCCCCCSDSHPGGWEVGRRGFGLHPQW